MSDSNDGDDKGSSGPFDTYFESLEEKRFQGHDEFVDAQVVDTPVKRVHDPDLSNPISDSVELVKSPSSFLAHLQSRDDVSGWMWAKALMMFFFSVWFYFVFDSSRHSVNVNLGDVSLINLLKLARIDQFLSSGGAEQLQSALLIKNQWALIEAPFYILLSLSFLSFITYFSLKAFRRDQVAPLVFSKVLYAAIIPYWFYPLKALPFIGDIGFFIVHVLIFLTALKVMTGIERSNLFLYSYILTGATKIICIFLFIGLMTTLLGVVALAFLMKSGLL